MNYLYLLFDADDTLFDFPHASARAFHIMCRKHGIPDTPEVYALYHNINLELWAAFDRGEVSKDFVTLERYIRFLKALDLKSDPAACNRDYLEALGERAYPLPYALETCKTLHERGHQLYIITNAVASVQRKRLESSPFAPLISGAFISEEAGASKPSGPTSTMSVLSCPASHRKTPWSSETLLPPICGVPITQVFPAAGSIPAGSPARQISIWIMKFRICAACFPSFELMNAERRPRNIL